jgi:hypothetical protein
VKAVEDLDAKQVDRQLKRFQGNSGYDIFENNFPPKSSSYGWTDVLTMAECGTEMHKVNNSNAQKARMAMFAPSYPFLYDEDQVIPETISVQSAFKEELRLAKQDTSTYRQPVIEMDEDKPYPEASITDDEEIITDFTDISHLENALRRREALHCDGVILQSPTLGEAAPKAPLPLLDELLKRRGGKSVRIQESLPSSEKHPPPPSPLLDDYDSDWEQEFMGL